MKGKFIVLEGLDGCGKSTQAKILASKATVFREPGSSDFGEKIRYVLLNGGDLTTQAETMLFNASRAQLMPDIRKTLESGHDVVLDRWAYSTFAYQQDLEFDFWKALTQYVAGGIWPNIVFWLDVDVNVARSRTLGNDRFERRNTEFYIEVRGRYKFLYNHFRNIIHIDASQPIEAVTAAILEGL